MTVYRIHDDLTVTAFADRKTAEQHGNGPTIKSVEELRANKNLTLTDLVKVYNGLSETPVKKFSDRAAAARRTWEAMQSFWPVITVCPSKVAQGAYKTQHEAALKTGHTMAGKVGDRKVSKSTTAAATPSGRRGRAVNQEHMGKTLNAPKNYRRVANAAQTALQFIVDNPGCTTEQFLEAGGALQDLNWDVKKGYVTAS